MVQHTKFTSYDGKTCLFSLPNTIKLNNPILIAGFPGPGLVGSISINYVIKKIDMQQILCFESEFIVLELFLWMLNYTTVSGFIQM
jgi:proteasome assembly chaperone (PAC2) family protein